MKDTSTNKKILISSILGNALEFYDFTLYGVLAVVLAGQYFPGKDETAKLLFSLAAFAVGFLTRPLGAILFGHIGDTLGRKKALSFSILLMGIPTFLIGVTPGYQQIGLFASILVFSCRLLQGIFTGGEYNGAAIYSIEHLGRRFPGLIGGLITGSCVIGAIGATLFGAWTQGSGMPEWSWRIPFIFGGIIGLMGYFMRRNMIETPEFASLSSKNKTSLLNALRSHPRASLIAFSFGSFNGALTYTLFGFLNIYLSRYLHIPLAQAMKLNLVGLCTFMIGNPSMGYLFDRLGQKRFLIGAIFSIFAFAPFIFIMLISKTLLGMICGQMLLGLCTASIAGTGHAVLQRLFPVGERYRGVAFNFSLGMGIFGGITPMIYVHMIEKSQITLLFPAIFLMAFSILFAAIMIITKMLSFPVKAIADDVSID